MSPTALACPASLKGVLSAREAAAALVEGLGGERAVALPVADGGEGTLEVLHSSLGGVWREVEVVDAFGRPRRARWLALPDGTAAVESAEAVPLDPGRLDALEASSRGLGELIRAVGSPSRLLVGLGGVAVTDGGAGLREVLDELPAPTEALCDVRVALLDAARLFAPQKGASPAQVEELVRRLEAREELAAYAELPGAGAAGGLGAALAALGAGARAGCRAAARARAAAGAARRGLARDHRRGDRRPHDRRRQGAGSGCARGGRGRRALRRLRRARRRACRGSGDRRALR
jgi:glycerate kinase